MAVKIRPRRGQADHGRHWRHLRRASRFAWLSFFFLPVGCASSSTVTRMVRGRIVSGPFVGNEAYVAYLKGAALEAQGNGEAAISAYAEAIRRDPHSAELLTRVGALRCAAGAKEKAREAFDRASRIDPAHEETWTEWARCHLRHGELDAAVRAVRFAITLDPNRTEPVVLLTLVLERQGNLAEATRWLDGLVVREPASMAAHEAMAAFAARTGDEARRLAAEGSLAVLRPEQDTRSKVRASVSEVDAALTRSEFDRARRLALSARVSSGALALRAAALGSVAFAKTQAELVLAADPADSDARIAAAVAADLARDEGALGEALSTIPLVSTPPSSLATLLMGELLGRRVGLEAQKAWETVAGTASDDGDPLVARVTARR